MHGSNGDGHMGWMWNGAGHTGWMPLWWILGATALAALVWVALRARRGR